MGRPRKGQLDTAYPPRLMRASRAAAYLDMSESTFLRLVDAGELPQGIEKNGLRTWDRHKLDAAVENWGDKPEQSRDAAVILGLKAP